MKMTTVVRWSAMALLIGFCAMPVFASGTEAPWNGPVKTVADWLTGPTAKLIGLIALALAAYGLMFAEGGAVWRKVGLAGLGIAIVVALPNIAEGLFGSGGALVGGSLV